MPRLEFWYEFASTYSYLSAMRIESLAKQAGMEIEWRPFLLGPIFKAQGWDTSPFNLYPAKGRYMIRDLERLAGKRGLAFHMPSPFPANSLKAARLALIGAEEGWVAPFSRAVFEAEFARHQNIADSAVLTDILASLGLDSARLFRRAEEPAIKQRLKDHSDAAASRGIFGAPTFVTTDGELFWGDDRLEEALRWLDRS
jgi:2-hydroxychromene-2-carboxylate isomerase